MPDRVHDRERQDRDAILTPLRLFKGLRRTERDQIADIAVPRLDGDGIEKNRSSTVTAACPRAGGYDLSG
jgi:hypothetical protein